MLQDIGDKLKGMGQGGGGGHRWLGYLILGAIAVTFIAWGPYSMVDLTFGQADYAAKVNGEEIPAERLNRSWQERLPRLLEAFGGELTEAQREQFQQELLDSTIKYLAAAQYARKAGFRVSDGEVSKAFREEEAFQVDGQFNLQAARARLASVGVSEHQYVQDLRQDLLTDQLLGVVGISGFLTSAEGKRILALLDEERELRYVLLQPEDFAGPAPVEPAAIEAYYQAHQDEFAIPEAVRLAYAELSLGDIAAGVEVTEEQLRARFEQDKAIYEQPETRRARHILIAEDGADAEKRARELYGQVRSGADFAALAKANSADSASAQNGGDLGWSGRDVYVKEFADKLFSMQEGEVAEPVKTQFGWHIIRLEGIRPATGRSFEEVRGELAATLRNELAINEFGSREDRLQERLERGATNLDELATQFGFRKGEVARFERGAGGLPLGSDPELNREVFGDASLSQRRVGGPAQLGEGRITIFQVQEHFPAGVRPLAEVREAIVASLLRERGANAAHAAAGKALQELEAGKPFDAVAATLRAKPEPPRFHGRGTPELPVELRDAVFAAPRPAPGKPVRQVLKLEGGPVALVEVTGSRAQPSSDNPQLQMLRTDRELARYSQRDIQAYLSEIVGAATIRKNPQAFLQ